MADRAGIRSTEPKKDSILTMRCSSGAKLDYQRAAERMGFDELSEFMLATLDSAAGRINSDGWQCRLIHLSDDTIVAIGEVVDTDVPLPVSAYPIVAPERFWKLLEQTLKR